MRITAEESLSRLLTHDHGILATVHPERGVDAVPVVYAVLDNVVAIPVDQVKPKAAGRLQRERNLQTDPRASLLVEHWDPVDWSRLWWVRAELRWATHVGPSADRLTELLATKYPQYADAPFDRLLTLSIVAVTGWSAAAGS